LKKETRKHMNWMAVSTLSVAGAALVLSACGAYASGGSSGGYGSANPPAGSGGPPGSPTTALDLRYSPLGQILVDGSGKTLYVFGSDKSSDSTCYDACAQVWPPLLASGAVQAGRGVNSALLGSTTRKDGSKEVTYNGHPLYYFASDKQAGDTTGQALSSFGAEWYALSASGDTVSQGY
jgi:predicted lipoprotein with Yx(FWY)xxD motif